MAFTNSDSPEVLREEILADARRESDEILRHAREEADDLLAKAAAEAEQIRQGLRAQTRAEAARRRELVLAGVAVEAARRRSARVEFVLQSVRQATRQKLLARDGFDYQETIIALTVEALRRMAGDMFVVRLSPADHAALDNGLAEKIAQRIGRPSTVVIHDDPTIEDGGAIIQDREGRQIWDNRFLSRLERLWPELRRQIAAGARLVAHRGAPEDDP
ncbi:MAG: V-type ATP synthase subunit E [Verrucomicrobiota bacterium]|nr:V-type ATP synthase subunit E [Verrucomicrobiota bacterium]